ncbi:MAG: peptidase domain-containing ABC transporter [Steroidobacteraceae bacterium]
MSQAAATQADSTAVAALVRVARHHGLEYSAEELIRAHQFEGPEPAPALLSKMAERAGLQAKAARIQRGELAGLADSLPAIMLLPQGKALILEKVHDQDGVKLALIEDPGSATGTTVLVDEPRLFESWNGELMLLSRRWKITDQDKPFGFSWLLGQFVLERRLVRDISVAAIFMSLLALFPVMIVMVVLDRVINYKSFSTLGVITVALIAVTLFETTFGYLRRLMILIASSRIDARINLHVFDKLINLKMSYFEKTPTGVISGKIGQIWKVRSFIMMQVFGTLLDSVTLLVLLPVLFYLNWKLTFYVLGLAFGILGIYIAFLPEVGRRTGRVIAAEQAMGSHMIETIYGIRTVKSLCLEGLKRFQRDRRVAKVIETHRDLDRISNWPQTLVMPLERMIYSGTIIIGCYMALTDPDGTTAGTVIAFAMLAGRVTGPIVSMAGMLNAFEDARGALGEVASVMNQPPEEGRTGTGLRLPISGHVIFDEVRFRYSPTAAYALNEVSFEIPRGTIFGVMGRSGSGKTTVTRLLQGLNREYQGTIKIDGMDLRQIDLDHLRSSIGVVPQENFLFSGTIRDNISAPRPNAGMEVIVRAAQMAGAEEFIERLEKGYDTEVEEGAVNFSGGQRQRLAIARALLVDPQILILDEATSALDAESEAIVNANLMRIAAGRTVIIISHRLSSLMTADAILVLERGKFYDVGKHEELLQRCDIYQSLWYQQNRHMDPKNAHARTSGRPTAPA